MKNGNFDVIKARYDAVNSHDLDRFESFYADGVEWRDPATDGSVKGPSAVRKRLESWIEAVPNLEWRLEELFGDGDKICARFTFTGEHRGALADRRGNELAATNGAIEIEGVGVYTVEDGRIVDSRIYFDLAEFGPTRD